VLYEGRHPRFEILREEVNIDWAHRVLINNTRQQRMIKMMILADDKYFSYQNETELNLDVTQTLKVKSCSYTMNFSGIVSSSILYFTKISIELTTVICE